MAPGHATSCSTEKEKTIFIVIIRSVLTIVEIQRQPVQTAVIENPFRDALQPHSRNVLQIKALVVDSSQQTRLPCSRGSIQNYFDAEFCGFLIHCNNLRFWQRLLIKDILIINQLD